MNKRSLIHDFDKLAPYYDRIIKILLTLFGTEKKLRLKIVESIRYTSLPKDARILEIGCGTGANIHAIDQAFPENFIFFCVDISSQMLEEARKKKYNSKISFIKCDASQLAFGNEEFEFILSVFVLHEMSEEKQRQAVHEIYRVLKPGRYVLVADFSNPKSFPGKILFKFLRLIESKEALTFIRQGPVPLFEKAGMILEADENLILDISKIYLFKKPDFREQELSL